jgi:hypothetical protein
MMETSGKIKRGSNDREFFSISCHLDFDEIDRGDIPTVATPFRLENGEELLFVVSPEEGDKSELWTESDLDWTLMRPPTGDWPFYEKAEESDIPEVDRAKVEYWLKKEIRELEDWLA